nr:MAG TPA: hypothetical protein [Caudoviricetes sp.]
MSSSYWLTRNTKQRYSRCHAALIRGSHPTHLPFALVAVKGM